MRLHGRRRGLPGGLAPLLRLPLRLAAVVGEAQFWSDEVSAAASQSGTLQIVLPGALGGNVKAHVAAGTPPAQDNVSGAALELLSSGTTGPPKGAVMPHSCLIGNLPGFIYSHDGYPQPGDVFWSPADWAWTGGLMDALLPTLHFGQPIVGFRGRFDPERARRGRSTR